MSRDSARSDEELLNGMDRRFGGDGPVRSMPQRHAASKLAPEQQADLHESKTAAPPRADAMHSSRGPVTEDGPSPAIILWGRMNQELKVIREQVGHLPHAETDYTGSLRVILTHATMLGDNAKRLLKMADDGGGF